MPSLLLDLPPEQSIVIPSKITVPALPPAHLPRPALVERLQDAIARRLTLVVAPAGHGKTTAVAETVRSWDVPTAWVTLDRRDREPVRVWRHVTAALDGIIGRTTPDPPPPVGQDALEATIRGLHDHHEQLVFVLDDSAGVITGEAATILDAAIDWMPPRVHVVVLARSRPPLSVARRRVAGQLAEIGGDDLRMTPDEVVCYLNDVCRLGLATATIAEMARATEGWPALLAMVADHVRSSRAAPDPDLRPPDAEVLELVLAGLSQDEVDVLGQLVALDRVTGPRCRASTGRADAELLLDGLVRHGVLLPDPRHPGVLRHHGFVRAALRRRLADLGDDDWRGAGRRAARWLAVHGQSSDAVRCALEVGDSGQALRWLDELLDDIVGEDGGRLLRETTSRVAPEALSSHPRLVTMALDAHLLAGDRDGIERLLDALDRGGAPVAQATRARQHLGRLRGDDVTIEGAERVASPLGELALLAELAWNRAVAGRLGEADLLVRRVARGSERWGLERLPARALLAKGQIALDRRRSDLALRCAREVQAWADHTDDVASWVEAGLLVGRCRGTNGDLAAASAMLDAVRAHLDDVPHGGALALRVARADASLLLAAGEVDSLPLVLPELFGHSSLDEVSPEDRVLLARVYLRRGDAARALALASTLEGEEVGPRVRAEAARVVAAAARSQGDVAASRRARARAAGIARAEGLVEVPSTHRSRDWPSERPTIPGVDVVVPTATELRTAAVGPSLTEREQHVLRQLPSRLSNIEIAAELYVSENTVKSHLKSIYRKLGVRTRRDAISRARSLGLLPG